MDVTGDYLTFLSHCQDFWGGVFALYCKIVFPIIVINRSYCLQMFLFSKKIVLLALQFILISFDNHSIRSNMLFINDIIYFKVYKLINSGFINMVEHVFKM